MNLLLVEDDAASSDALAELLRDEGHTVFTAYSGRQALESLEARRPDLILLDLMLPDVNGWEFRRRQLGNPAWASIPVVVVSAVSPGSELSGLPAVRKPVRFDELLHKMRHLKL